MVGVDILRFEKENKKLNRIIDCVSLKFRENSVEKKENAAVCNKMFQLVHKETE